MCKSTKGTSWTVPSLPHIIAFSRLIDLRMELLLSAGMAILTAVPTFTFWWLSPLISMFYTWTRRGSVFELSWVSSPVSTIVIMRTGISLAAKSGWLRTLFSLIAGEYKICILYHRQEVEGHEDHGQRHNEVHSSHNVLENRFHEYKYRSCNIVGDTFALCRPLSDANMDNRPRLGTFLWFHHILYNTHLGYS